MAATEAQSLSSEDLARFRVILDEPAAKLGASFDVYADALAEIVLESSPQFAIGIFGDWGSGKTTLMQAIESRVKRRDSAVAVWFNAWRYEKEAHLIVPLLDTLRAALVAWAEEDKRRATPAAERAREAAKVVGRAARALFAGLSVTVGLPPVDLGFDGGKALEAFKDRQEDEATSFYFASFTALRDALKQFFESGAERIVVFVDDLDRCLPNSALEVLESMKLFFDLEGFVFVVGLDQGVIERSIEAKYQPAAPVFVVDRDGREETTATGPDRGPQAPQPPRAVTPTGTSAPISGAEYVKKIFQVPFTLPRISTSDLAQFFDELLDNAGLEDKQKDHLKTQLGPHLGYLSGESAVNPRELKRMVNAYTVQSKMLNAKLDDFEPEVLAVLLTIGFRTEWRRVYDTLVESPTGFVGELGSRLPSEGTVNPTFAPDARVLGEAIPLSFMQYVYEVGRPLLRGELEPYISSVESGHTGDPNITEALKIVRRFRTAIAVATDDPEAASVESRVRGDIETLLSVATRFTSAGPAGEEIPRLTDELGGLVGSVGDPASRDSALSRMRTVVDRLYDVLRELRRQTTIGAAS